MIEKKPSLADPMWRMLHEHGFVAVVLLHNPQSDEGREFYDDIHFGRAFIERLERDYELSASPEGKYIYTPRSSIGP